MNMINSLKTLSSKKMLYGFLAAAVLGAAFFGGVRFFLNTDSVLQNLPSPDLTGIEKQVAEKIQTYRKEVVENSSSAEAWARLAMVLHIHDFKPESIPCYKQALKLNPDEFRWSYYYAVVLSETGSPEAFDWFERCQVLKPDYSPLHILYGRALYDAGRTKEATHAFQRAIALGKNLSHAYLGLGKIFLSQDDLQKSRQFLSQALEAAPQHREVHSVLAEVYRRLGETGKSVEERKIAQQLPNVIPLEDPVYDELVAQGISAFWYRERGFYYQGKGLLEEAVQELEMALKYKPDPVGHNYIANLLSDLNRFDEAVNQYRTAITLAPDYFSAYINLGRLLFEIGQTKEAQLWVQKALRINPGSADAYLSLGTFYMETNRDAEAIAILRRGLKLTQGSMSIALRLAWLLATTPKADLRNGEEALRLAKPVNERLKNQDAKTLDVLSVAYAETGRFAQAVKTAHQAYEFAVSGQQKELAEEIQSRLALFQANRPFRRPQ